MDWDHHSVFQHPIDVRLAVSRALLDVHVGQAEAVEEDDGGSRVRHAFPSVDFATFGLELADARARSHGGEQHLRHSCRRIGKAPGRAFRLALYHPGLAAVPAIKIDGAVAVEHDVAAGLDHVALEAGSERERGICATRMTPHHTARIAHETAQLGDGARIGLAEIPPGRTLVPGGDGASDRRLVEGGRALQQPQLGLGLYRARKHQRVVAIRDLEPLDLQTEPEAHVVEANAPVLEPEILERATDGAGHVEGISRAGMGYPRRLRPILRDETTDITALRW